MTARAAPEPAEGEAPLTLDVFFDYVCPYCLIVEDAVEQVAERRQLAVRWLPFELRPYPSATLRPEDPYLPAVWRDSVYPRAAAAAGVPISLPTTSPQPWSHAAFEGRIHAASHGVERAWDRAVLRAFFQEDRDIGDLAVLAAIGEAVGLDPAQVREALQERRYEGAHQAALREGRAAHISAVPTLRLGRHSFAGAPDEARLDHFVGLVLDERSASAGPAA